MAGTHEPRLAAGAVVARIAGLDTGATLFFDHRDPAMVSLIGNRPIHH